MRHDFSTHPLSKTEQPRDRECPSRVSITFHHFAEETVYLDVLQAVSSSRLVLKINPAQIHLSTKRYVHYLWYTSRTTRVSSQFAKDHSPHLAQGRIVEA